MNMTKRAILIAIPALTGCGDSASTETPISTGTLTICEAGDGSSLDDEFGEDMTLDISGTVIAINSDAVECSRSITVENADGDSWTVGLSVTDDQGEDVLLDIDLELDDTVELVYRSRLVWGEVKGFTISDSEGLVLAVEEGTWGGALEPELLEGFSTSRNDELLATEREECMVRKSYAMEFEGDESLTLQPYEEDFLFVNSQQMRAVAVASVVPGPGKSCTTSDTTDIHSWLLSRVPTSP